MIVSIFSTEPKSRYAAQSDYFTVKAEPSRLREKIRPEGKDGCSCLRKAVVKAAPVGCVSRYNKQGLCVPQKSPSQPKSAGSLGGAAPNPPKRRDDIIGKDIRIAVRVTAKEKEKIQSKARKCGLSTTEYVKQRALGYEPRTVPPDALFACLEKLGELADKASSPELDKEIYTVLKQITAEFLLPGKG